MDVSFQYSLSSAAYLAIGVLGLHMYTTTSSFVWVLVTQTLSPYTGVASGSPVEPLP